MKNKFKFSIVILLIIFFQSCKKEMPRIPVIATKEVTEITLTTAISGGDVIDEGGAPLINKGVCWDTSEGPNIENDKTNDGSGPLSFTSNISQLAPNKIYFVRAFASNKAGTGYGESVSFVTLGDKPFLNSLDASNIQPISATLNGTVNPNSLSTIVSFEYGVTANFGNTIIAKQSPITGNNSVNASVDLSGLMPGTTYLFRIKGENSFGISYGNIITFTTTGGLPTAIIQAATNLQINSARVNGSVNANFLSSTAIFEYGLTISYGYAVSALQNTISGNTVVNINANLSGLTEGTAYHFRIKATNDLGTTYSNDMTFTTLSPITDIDGNVYNIETIGTQIWMTENLKTTKYRNGDLIGTTVFPLLDISGESTPKYQWPCAGNESNVSTYGRLYTWFTVTDSRSICPTGWHIPTDYEWMDLTNYLTNNGYGYGGNSSQIAKSMASISLWIENPTPGAPGNNQASNNSSGFNGVPGGVRSAFTGGVAFSSLGGSTAWWSSTELDATIAWQRLLELNNPSLMRSYYGGKKIGVSVRCLKN
jgi:uncharacterized protein (TIGR02145 family)